MDLNQAIDGFLDYLARQRAYSAHTVEAYRRDLTQFAAFVDANGVVPQVESAMTKAPMRGWLYECGNQGMKPRTIARKVAALKSFSKYLVRQGALTANPGKLIATPRLDKPLPSFLTQTQAAQLDSVRQGSTPVERARNRAIVELFYGSGMRLAELHALDLGTIERSQMTVRVMGKGRKERIVPVTRQAVEAIDEYTRIRSDGAGHAGSLFANGAGGRLSMRQIQRIVTRALGEVTQQKKRSPHVLRHTFATHMLDGGADVRAIKELLGHASLGTTQVYTHVSKEHLLAAYHQAHPRGGSGEKAPDPA